MMRRRSFLAALLGSVAFVPAARAALSVTQLTGFGAGGGAISLSFLGHAVSTTDTANYTFSSKTLGADGNRQIVVVADASGLTNSSSISSLTVAGISATLVKAQSGSNNSRIEMWIANVPSGATGDIVVNWALGRQRCGIQWWRLENASSSAFSTDSAANSDPLTMTALSVPAGGVALGGSCSNAGGSTTFTITGLTEESGSDEVVESAHSHVAFSSSFTTAQTPTITINTSVGSATNCAVAASFAAG